MKLVGKSVLFIGIIFFLQTILIRSYESYYIPEYIQAFEDKLRNGVDILYFGDSTLYYTNEADQDKRPIYTMLQENVPSKKVMPLYHDAYHADVYLAYVRAMLRAPKLKRPNVVIVPINLHTFSPDIDKRPADQFAKEKIYLQYYHTPVFPFLDFLFTMKAFTIEPITADEFSKTPVYFGTKQVGMVKDYQAETLGAASPENIRKQATYYYLYFLDENHRKLRSLVEIGKQLRQSNIEVVFYTTPIDYQAGEQYLPGEFRRQVEANYQVMQKALNVHNFTVLNLTFDLPSDEFSWRGGYMNEHLNDEGRAYVAQKIAETIKTQMR